MKTVDEAAALVLGKNHSLCNFLKRGLLPEYENLPPISEDEIKVLKMMQQNIESFDDMYTFFSAYENIIKEKICMTTIDDTIATFAKLKCSKEELKKEYTKITIYYVKSQDIERIANLFKSYSFTKDQISRLIIKAAIVPYDYLEETITLLYSLSSENEYFTYFYTSLACDGFLLYSCYNDPIGAIKHLKENYAANAIKILKEHPDVLYLYKRDGYSDDIGFENDKKDLEKILKKFKTTPLE